MLVHFISFEVVWLPTVTELSTTGILLQAWHFVWTLSTSDWEQKNVIWCKICKHWGVHCHYPTVK